MKETIAERKERYIDEAYRRELGVLKESDTEPLPERIKFWQGLTATDRFNATEEIVQRVEVLRSGDTNDRNG